MANNQKFDRALTLVPYSASASSFHKYIADSKNNKEKLFSQIRNCRIDQCKCRFNVWRMLMEVLPINGTLQQKSKQISNQRQTFKSKKEEAFTVTVASPNKQAPIPKNPLMKAMVKAPKVQQTNDQFLKDQIRKDVERTYQQTEFFQQKSILKLLSNVLFVWCKRNPDVSYKQGMNQVLASIVYVYFQQVYAPPRIPQGFEELSQQNKKVYIQFNSIEHAQADVYGVFQKIMNIQNQMYKTETDSNLKGVINPNSKNNTPILQRIITIVDQKLKLLDIELFRVFKLQDVQTKTFLLRWIRCMHTRQFSLQNSFIIWDSIFLDYFQCPSSKQKNQFQFIDSMCVAMFVYMRSIALTRQTSYEILQTYQKYPSLKKGGYLEELISLAWSLNDALRQPASLASNNDWAAQNNINANSEKLKNLKSRQSPVLKQQPPPPKQQAVQTKPKQKQTVLPAKPKQNVIEVKETKIQKKQQVPIANNTPVNQKVAQKTQAPSQSSSAQSSDKNLIYPDLNFSIVLQAVDWQTLVEKLQKSLALNNDEQSRKFTIQAIQILKSKFQSMGLLVNKQ